MAKGKANEGGRPYLVYQLSDEQCRAIIDYFFARETVKSLRDLAPILQCSIQGADNIAHKVLGQWARQGKLIPRI